MSGGCHTHPLRPARFRCDGCGHLLCDACVEEGHRLLLCGLCGERALPLESQGPTNVKERDEARRQTLNAGYAGADVLRYCFRGEGRWIFWMTVVIFAVFQFFLLAAMIAPISRMFLPATVSALLFVFLLWIVPPQLVLVVRSTYRGHNELPAWAAAHELPERSREVVALLLALAVGLAPSGLALRFLGCSPFGDESSLFCTLALLATLPVMVATSCLGFAAFAEFETRWLVLRIDLHLRFLLVVGGEAWLTFLSLLAGSAALVVVRELVGSVPLLFLVPYLLFTGAHALGVLFRRHRASVERIYGFPRPEAA